MKEYLTNCQVILPDEVAADSAILIEDDRIAAISPCRVQGPVRERDLSGAFLMPGMIDLHSDAIESLAEPRSGIYLPFELAAIQADQLASMNGITTFFNAVSFAGEELGLRKGDAPARLVQAVSDYRPHAMTDQRVHCRYEVTVEDALAKILQLMESGACNFVSYMDHSPGQGQFQDEANYRSYMSARYGYNDATISELLKSKMAEGSNPSGIESRVKVLARVAGELGIPLAGHDADSARHVQEMVGLGASLAEFPMSSEAAEEGLRHGLHQSVGSVNVIRGGSQRTGMSASKLILAKQADCLCSDYVPATLLPAVLKMVAASDAKLHEVVKVVTSNPARAARLEDRGEIKEGLRADLVAFSVSSETKLPSVITTWSAGRAIYSALPAKQRTEKTEKTLVS